MAFRDDLEDLNANLKIVRDRLSNDFEDIVDPVWLDADGQNGPEKTDPAAYTSAQAQPMKVELTVVSTTSLPVQIPGVTLKGITRSNPAFTFEADGLTMGPGTEFTFTIVTGESLAQNTTRHFSPLNIDWEVSYDDTNFGVLGTTSNDVYVTWDDPGVFPVYLTALHLAIGQGNKTQRNEVITDTWDRFKTRNVKNWDGDALSYYKSGSKFSDCFFALEGLLKDGTSQCNAWAELLWLTLLLNGIESTQVIATPQDDEGFLVKNWELIGQPQVPGLHFRNEGDTYGMVPLGNGVYGDLRSLSGIPGQHSPTPSQKAFLLHVILYLGEAGLDYLDPSYGTTYTDETDFETKAVFGYFRNLRFIQALDRYEADFVSSGDVTFTFQ